jgi:hypothetical protein
MIVLKRWAENLGGGFLKLKKEFNGSLILGKVQGNPLFVFYYYMIFLAGGYCCIQDSWSICSHLPVFLYNRPYHTPFLFSSHIVSTILLVCIENAIRSLFLKSCLFIQQ